MVKVAEIIVERHEQCPYYKFELYPDWETGRCDEYYVCRHPDSKDNLGCTSEMYAPPPKHCPLKERY